MPRARHGQYDRDRHLPDNTGQAVGSGLYIWFHEQIHQLVPDGDALVEESHLHGSGATKWLLGQLDQRGASELIAEYHTRRKQDAVEWEWAYKAALIRGIEAQLAEELPPSRREDLEKDLAKKQRAFEKHNHQGSEPLP